jgi:branched-chain amino acid transport system substrate-binding protein
MKHLYKIVILLTVAIMLVSACTPAQPATPAAGGSQEQASNVIKVGALYPLTGADAGWAGDPYIKATQMAIDEINAAGGIKCLNGAKLELVNGDTQSKAEVGNSEFERLVTKEGVVAVMGSALSQTTLPATELADKYEVPYIVPNALDGTITAPGHTYVFQTVNTLQDMGTKDAQWAKDQGAKTAVVAVPNISFGKEVADTWEKNIKEQGLELKENFTYEANTNDFTDTILRIKASNPDVLFIVGNADTPQFTKQLKEQGYYPTMGIITLGSGFSTSFFLDQVTAPLADGIIFTSDFAPVSKLPVPEEFKTAFKDKTGQDLGGTYNTTYASTWLLADALEKSCSTDPKKLAETLHNTKFEGGKWGFQWPSASFDANGRLNEAGTVIGQWQDGKMVAVWPDSLAANKAVWPVPGWDNRENGIGAAPVATEAAAATEAPANDPALASDYSQALLKDAQTPVDTSMYKKDGPYTIAVAQQDPSNGWGNTYNVTIDAYGKELLADGVLAKPLLVSATNDANQQISDVENFIEQQPDAIVIEPAGRAASVAVIERAVDAGIPVILCANGIESDKFTTRVDVDFYEVAYKSGDGLAKLLGGKGNIVVFNGIAGVDSTETWVKAAKDAWSKYPDIKIVAEDYAQWNIATAKQKMEAIMAANPQIDGVWAGGGEMALGAALAYEDAGKTAPKFGMVNVPNGFLRLADQYKYEYVGSPDPPSMSKYCLQTAIDILQGKPVMKFISLKTLMDGAEPYDQTTGGQWYVPELNDDFIPPATVDVQNYIDGGFGRK